ncbi:hypothetical protein [Streptomyces phaeoluteigriseus]
MARAIWAGVNTSGLNGVPVGLSAAFDGEITGRGLDQGPGHRQKYPGPVIRVSCSSEHVTGASHVPTASTVPRNA